MEDLARLHDEEEDRQEAENEEFQARLAKEEQMKRKGKQPQND